MKYLCLVYPAEEFAITPEVVSEFLKFQRAATDAGVFIDSGRLQPADTATTLRLQHGEAVLTDGPFAEIKEHVGGYVLLDCADLDEVITWASTLPGVRDGAVEIRPLLMVAPR
ncbi:MAG: YciI family protein [Chloroflexi bacterium]|nr:MAG: YciI family protein [Chloroflexota bacterium]